MGRPSPDYARDYELGHCTELRALERCVLGSDYGATSWTTRREALRVAGLLRLRPAARLLDVGAGSGWPGLFLARVSGCGVVLVDRPLVALAAALERATADGLQQRCRVVAADGARLPFNDGSFDAVGHSDVLCCTPAKLPILRACRRVAAAGARMVFSVITLAPCLSGSERRIAIESGPEFVEAADDYGAMLAQTAWHLLQRSDESDEFAQSLGASVQRMQTRAGALREALGPAELCERMDRRRATLAAVRAGLLKRELFVAEADPRDRLDARAVRRDARVGAGTRADGQP